MLIRPTPTELDALIAPDRSVEDHRNVFCECYDFCLDEAVSKRWISWTCARCQLFAPEVTALESDA